MFVAPSPKKATATRGSPRNLKASARADDRGQAAADDRVRAEVPALDVVEVHRAAVAVAAALDLPVELGHELVRVRALRERVPVRAVRRGDHVVVLERAADADRDRLLADRDVEEAGQLAGAEALLDLLLEAADEEHLAEEVLERVAARGPGSSSRLWPRSHASIARREARRAVGGDPRGAPAGLASGPRSTLTLDDPGSGRAGRADPRAGGSGARAAATFRARRRAASAARTAPSPRRSSAASSQRLDAEGIGGAPRRSRRPPRRPKEPVATDGGRSRASGTSSSTRCPPTGRISSRRSSSTRATTSTAARSSSRRRIRRSRDGARRSSSAPRARSATASRPGWRAAASSASTTSGSPGASRDRARRLRRAPGRDAGPGLAHRRAVAVSRPSARRSRWKAIEADAEVVASDGDEVAPVSRIVGDPNADVFTGLAVLVGTARRTSSFVPAERVRRRSGPTGSRST